MFLEFNSGFITRRDHQGLSPHPPTPPNTYIGGNSGGGVQNIVYQNKSGQGGVGICKNGTTVFRVTHTDIDI